MTELEKEKEIQARVEFKMKEFLTGVKNRLGFKYGQAFDMTQRSNDIWQAFEEVSQMLNKEIYLPTPYDNMSEQRKKQAKDKAVEKIVKSLTETRIDYTPKIRTIVTAIEEAQDW